MYIIRPYDSYLHISYAYDLNMKFISIRSHTISDIYLYEKAHDTHWYIDTYAYSLYEGKLNYHIYTRASSNLDRNDRYRPCRIELFTIYIYNRLYSRKYLVISEYIITYNFKR